MARSRISRASIAVVIFLAASCSSSNPDGVSPPVPQDLRITLGDGGGFSGLWSGFTLTAGDSVYRWTGRFPGDNSTFSGRLPADSLRALWRTIETSHLLDSASTDVQANLVHILAIRAHGLERSFTWGETPEKPGVSEFAYRLVVRMRSLLARPLQK